MANNHEAKRREFLALCEEIINRTEAIDRDTEWSVAEPRWWLDMMAMQREAIRARKLHRPSNV